MAEEKESFSFLKWISGFKTATTWAKAVMFLLMAVIIIGIPAYAGWRIYTNGRIQGRAEQAEKCRLDFEKYIRENPPIQTGNNATINNNVCPKIDKFGLQMRGCTVGMICEKK